MHTYIHTLERTYTHTQAFICIHNTCLHNSHIRTYMHAHTLAYIHNTFIHTHTCTYIVHAYIHSYIRKYIHYVRTYIHTYIHTYTHTHTQKQVLKKHMENAINVHCHTCTTVPRVPNLVTHYMYGGSAMKTDRPQRSQKFEWLTYRDGTRRKI